MNRTHHGIGNVLLASLLLTASPVMASASATPAQQIPPLTARTFSIDGEEIHYRIGGRGPFLLLLHGFTLTGSQWEQFLATFMQRYTVIVPDLPGHGRSSFVPGHFDFARTARALHALLDDAGAEQVFGVGHSAGGITLLHMALQRPERLAAMTLVSAPHRFEREGLEKLRSETFESLSDESLAFYRALHPGGDDQIRRLHEQAGWIADDHRTFAVSAEQLSALAVPAMIVWGDRDGYLPVEIAVELYRALPDAQLWVVPGQGHVPVFEFMGGSAIAANAFPALVNRFFGEHGGCCRGATEGALGAPKKNE